MPEGYLLLPNFTTMGLSEFELRINRQCRQTTLSTIDWAGASRLVDREEMRTLHFRHIGLLASICYPTSDFTQLQLVTRFLTLLDCWVHTSCGYAHEAYAELFRQFCRETSKSWQKRFQKHVRDFQNARFRVLAQNRLGTTLDINQYKALRRDSSGIMLAFDLIEYAGGLHIPDDDHASSTFYTLKECAHDIVAWSQDINSYNIKQSNGDKHNLVAVLKPQQDLGAQSGVDAATALVKAAFQNFLKSERLCLLLDPDDDVRRYVQGLRDWIVGNGHWMYYTDLFFDDGDAARDSGWVRILPNAPGPDRRESMVLMPKIK